MTYLELLAKYPPKPLHSEAEYQRALRLLERLMTPHPSAALGALIEVHATLIEQYEAREHPTPRISPGELLSHLMEVRGTTAVRLGKATGISVATISSARRNKRGISKANAVKLANFFQVSPAAFLSSVEPANAH